MVQILKHPKLHLFYFNSHRHWSTKLVRFSLPIGKKDKTNRFFMVSSGFRAVSRTTVFASRSIWILTTVPSLWQIIGSGSRLSMESQWICIYIYIQWSISLFQEVAQKEDHAILIKLCSWSDHSSSPGGFWLCHDIFTWSTHRLDLSLPSSMTKACLVKVLT